MDSWIEINSVLTRVLHFGLQQDIDDNNSLINEKTIILMISGNPGEIGYYLQFMADIHKQTALPVIGLSHAGHNVVPKGLSIPSINDNPDLYSLNGQIVHKMSFFEKYISIDSKVILIGHSIGCYIILELLNRYPNIRSKVFHSILIFPTIESIGSTSEGMKYTVLFEWFKYPLLGLSYALNQFSDYYKQKLIAFVLSLNSRGKLVDCGVRSATNLFTPNCLKALIEMSLIEFKTVNELNSKAIHQNEDKLTFFYGESDHWCPMEYFHRISRLHPNCDINLNLSDIRHDFVLNVESTDRVSQLVVNKIKSILSKT